MPSPALEPLDALVGELALTLTNDLIVERPATP